MRRTAAGALVFLMFGAASCSNDRRADEEAEAPLSNDCVVVLGALRDFDASYTPITVGGGDASELFQAIDANLEAVQALYEAAIPGLPSDLADQAGALLSRLQSPPELGGETFGHENLISEIRAWVECHCPP